MQSVRDKWVKDALSDLGLTTDEAPRATIEALYVVAERQCGDETPEPDEDEIKVKTPPSRKQRKSHPYGWKGGKPKTIKRDAEITDKQTELLMKLRDDYGSPLVVGFARGLKIMLPARTLNEGHFRRLNRGQASDLIGALLLAANAGNIDKL